MKTITIKTIELQFTADELNTIRHKAVEQGTTIKRYIHEAIEAKMEAQND